MMSTSRPVKFVRLLVVLAVMVILAVGGYGFHKYRKRTIVRQALATGLAAYEGKYWNEAADQLGRYLAARPQDVDVLRKYADAQMRRRPQSKSTVQQAVSALETILRIERGQPQASETLVQLYLALNAPIEAERVARAWCQVHPKDMQAKQSLAAVLVPQQKLDEAVACLQEVVDAQPDRVSAASSLTFLRVTHKKQSVQEAREPLDKAVSAAPQSASAKLARAKFLMAAGLYQEARADVEAVEAQEPTELAVMLDLADLLTRMGFAERANGQFDRAEKAFADQPSVYLSRGRMLLESGDVQAGAALAERAIAAPLGDQRIDVLPLAAELFAVAGRSAQASKCIEQLKGPDTPSEMLLYLQGLALVGEGKIYDGIALLQDAVRRAPKSARAQLALGRALARAGDLTQATLALEEAVRLEGGATPQAYMDLSRVYATQARWRDAARAAGDAERQAPLNAQVLLNSIEMQALSARPGGDRPDAALIDRLHDRVKLFAERVPSDVRLQILLARLGAWRGQLDNAVTSLRALYDAPQAKAAASAGLSQIYAEARRYDEAIRECLVAVESARPEQRAAMQARLAELYIAAGKTGEAAALAESVSGQLASGDVVIALAESLAKAGQQDKAAALLAKAVEADGQNLRARLLLLSISPGDGSASRQALVDQVKRIEGPEGMHWRVWQARVWLEQQDWKDKRPQIEALLKESLTKFPNAADFPSLLAALYDRAGESDQALALYEQAYKAQPSDLRLARRLLDGVMQAQQWAKMDQLLSSLPSDEPSLAPYYISQALRRGDAARAAELLQARIQSHPDDYRSRLQMVGLKRVQGDAEGAEALLAEAARIAPDAVEVLAARVQLHTSRREYDAALDLCNQSLARKSQPEVLALRAAVHESKQDVAAARADWQELAKADGWAERACLALGQIQARQGRIEQAIQVWREGLQKMPESYLVGRALAAALLAGNEDQQAEGAGLLDQLLKRKPKDTPLQLMKAEWKERTQPAEAEAIYDAVSKQDPSAARAFERLAEIAAERGQRDRAVAIVDQGLAGSPSSVALLFLKADLLAQDSPGRAAVVARQVQSLARQALAAEPANEEAAIGLARAIALVEGPAAATASLQAFLKSNESADVINARLVLARLQMTAGNWAEADSLIGQCNQRAPADPRVVEARVQWHSGQKQWEAILSLVRQYRREHPDDLYVTLAAAQRLASAPDPRVIQEALVLMEAAVQKVPKEPRLLGELGLAYYRLGRIGEAKEKFQQALEAKGGHVGLSNNLAWILCEHDKNPKAAETIVADLLDRNAGTSDFASLLDTAGVIRYRLAMATKSQKDLAESRARLEACLRHPQVSPSTRVSATFHLARTLAALDAARSCQLLQDLLDDASKKAMLSPDDQSEAAALLQQLRAQGPAAKVD